MAEDERPDVNTEHDHGRIDQVDLQLEMQRSYLDYAMAVIIGRALPDVRDGLKPVHRRFPSRQVVLEVRARRRRGHGSVPPPR